MLHAGTSPGDKKVLQVAQSATLPCAALERLRGRQHRLGRRRDSESPRTTSERSCKDRSNHREHPAASVLHNNGEAKQGDLILGFALREEPQDLNDHHDHNGTSFR